jgi:hypothetical protein
MFDKEEISNDEAIAKDIIDILDTLKTMTYIGLECL